MTRLNQCKDNLKEEKELLRLRYEKQVSDLAEKMKECGFEIPTGISY